MKARLDGAFVRLGSEGRSLYDQSGYGRPEEGGLRLAPEEACYLLHRKRIEIPEYDFDRLFAYFAKKPEFLRTFLVYRDLRERGYAVQTGPQDFRVFRRGQKPGSGHSQVHGACALREGSCGFLADDPGNDIIVSYAKAACPRHR